MLLKSALSRDPKCAIFLSIELFSLCSLIDLSRQELEFEAERTGSRNWARMNKRKCEDFGEEVPLSKRIVGGPSTLFSSGSSLICNGEESMQVDVLPPPPKQPQEATASSSHKQPVTLLMAMSMSEKSGWEALPKRSRRRDRDNAMHD